MADKCNKTMIKEICFLLGKISKGSLVKTEKKNTLQVILQRQDKKQQQAVIKSRNEMSVCRVQQYHGAEAKEGTISSTRITSQDNPAVEIIHFMGTNLNGLCPNEFFILNKGQAFGGREWISLLVHACHSTLCFFSFFSLHFLTLILLPLFSILS